MTHKPVRTVAPAIQPVTATEVKAQLDVTYTDKDTQIAGLIAAATSRYDGPSGILGICLVEQSWRQDFDAFDTCLRLPFGPVISITSVTYLDAAGDPQTVDSDDYVLLTDEEGSYVEFVDGFSVPTILDASAVVGVTFKAGYANGGSDPNFTSTVPDAIKQMMFMLIRYWFDDPAGEKPVPMAVRSLEDQWVRLPL